MVLILDLQSYILNIKKPWVDLSEDVSARFFLILFFNFPQFNCDLLKTQEAEASPELVLAYQQTFALFYLNAQSWPVHFFRIHSLFTLFLQPRTNFKVIVNLFNPTTSLSIFHYTKALVSYKYFHCVIPDPVQKQIKTFFYYMGRHYLNQKASAFKLKNLAQLEPIKVKLGSFLYHPSKFHQKHLLNYRKHFRLWKQHYFKTLRTSFFLGKVRPIALKRLLARFVGKSLLAIGLSFSLNPILMVTRLFPFFDRFFIKQLFAAGLVRANFEVLRAYTHTLKPGDFVHIVWSSLFFKLYFNWIIQQQRYYFLMNRSLRQYYKAKRQLSFLRRKNYLRRFTWHTRLFQKIPGWIELNYLTLSFFIITVPKKLTFASYNFNPYLNRLLGF